MKPVTRKLPGWVHIPLIVLMAISFWQTAEGFEKLLGGTFSWAFSAAITMLMYGFTIFIGMRRLNNLPVISFLVAYFFFSLFSFTGNFNAVYTQYQKPQLFSDELLKHKQQLNDVVSAANKALNNFSPEITEKRKRLETLSQQLYSQITDPARPGLGKRALELISEIETLLGEKLTEFGTRNTKPEELAKRYLDNINQMARQLTSNDYDEIEILREFIKDSQEKTNNFIDSLLAKNDDVIRNRGAAANLQAVNAINDISLKVSNLVKDSSLFKFDEVKPENQEIGKIAFSFKSGFIHHPLHAFLFSILCLFIDWAVVLSLLVFFGHNEKEIQNPVRSSREM